MRTHSPSHQRAISVSHVARSNPVNTLSLGIDDMGEDLRTLLAYFKASAATPVAKVGMLSDGNVTLARQPQSSATITPTHAAATAGGGAGAGTITHASAAPAPASSPDEAVSLVASLASTLSFMALATKGVQRLLDSFLTMEHLEAGVFGIMLAPFAPATLLQLAHMQLTLNAQHAGIFLSAELDASLPPLLLGDFHRMLQVRPPAHLCRCAPHAHKRRPSLSTLRRCC